MNGRVVFSNLRHGRQDQIVLNREEDEGRPGYEFFKTDALTQFGMRPGVGEKRLYILGPERGQQCTAEMSDTHDADVLELRLVIRFFQRVHRDKVSKGARPLLR